MPSKDKRRASSDLDQFEVFPWNENFETGHATIDSQHKTLVDLLNILARTLVNDEVIQVNKAFKALADYADFHFTDEEAIWSEFFEDDYWLSSHQMSHSAFLPKVIELKAQESDKALTDVIEDIVKFLIRWLAFHIIDNDKRMAIAIAAMGDGMPVEEAKIFADKKMSGSMRVLIETILHMYDGLSSSAIDLMRERHARIKAEKELKELNRKLEALAITDQLTGLNNRRHFNTVFNQEMRRARREKRALTFFLIDIDYFKNYNDRYGHLEGDNALEQVGRALRETCRRPGDLPFRLGGEEFGVLATNLSNENAITFGEKLRAAIEVLKIPHADNKANVYLTVSAGLVNRLPSLDDTVEDFIRTADARLYQAKALGRNRVVVSD